MRKFFALCVLLLLVYQPLKAKEPVFRQSWVEVPNKVRLYEDYSLKKRIGYLEPGKYKLASQGMTYFQVMDTLYIKKSDKMEVFKIVYKPESYVSHEDTLEQHRQKVDARVAELTKVSPLYWAFMALVLLIMIVAFILN